MLGIEVVTLFPDLIRSAVTAGVLGRAIERRLVRVGTEDPRRYATDAHRTVDDRPYGGGPGMVLKAEPFARAIDAARERLPAGARRVALSAQGRRLTQADVSRLAGEPGIVLVAGRYEGFDQRLVDAEIDEELSIGDYVLSGGEFAALVVIDALVRLLPGVLGDEQSAVQESFADGLLDWPHYTRPERWRERGVPEVLQSGDHARIRRWRLQQALGRTWRRRPDLIVARGLDAAEWQLLEQYCAEAGLTPPGNGTKHPSRT
jgi:tRNA (guanine37-N1)-methyltransferase